MNDHVKKFFSSPLHVVLVGVFCLALLSGVVAVQVVRADGRILPNVTIGGINVGGLTPQEAHDRLDDAMRAVNVGGLQFHYQDRSLTVRVNGKSAAPPSQAPITYDLDGMVDAAFSFGHGNGPSDLIKSNMQALFGEVRQPVLVSVDAKALHDLLVLKFGGLEQPSMDASLKIIPNTVTLASEDASATPQTQTTWRIDISPDSTGLTFDYDDAVARATDGLPRWQAASTDLQATVKPPDVAASAIEEMKDRVLKVLQRGSVSLAFDDKLWTLPGSELSDALAIRVKPDGGPYVSLKPDVLEPLLDEAVKDVEIDAKPTHFKLNDAGRVIDFEGGALGKRVDREASIARLNEQFESSKNGVFPLVVTTLSSPDSDPIAEELGIRELLGYGTSNFANSPKNRRTNIANGAARLNGLVINPGQEIGLLEYLKPFNAAGGYVQELVIKDNRTVPEYGGGLCQIGTTTFRAVMGSGLPVTARQNHSYRVVYYEPAGTDATIYDPAPDFKFVNDTADHAVLITKISGDTARFELWGTRDGRVQAQSKIRMWNVTAPPAPKLIETSALPVGTKKCFETAHAGATTNFTYTITYPDGTVKAQDFHSVYKPWQSQCLIGTAAAPNIVIGRDGGIRELPPVAPTSAETPATPVPAVTPKPAA